MSQKTSGNLFAKFAITSYDWNDGGHLIFAFLCIRSFNKERPAYTLGYLTPKQYRERFAPKREHAAQTIAGNV